MTIAMQMVLNQFIEDNASLTTMHEVMRDLQYVEASQRVVNGYRERQMHDCARISQEYLEKAKEECSNTLLRAGIEYTVEELLNL